MSTITDKVIEDEWQNPPLEPAYPVRARGHFPNEAASLKCVYLAVMSLDPTGQGRRR